MPIAVPRRLVPPRGGIGQPRQVRPRIQAAWLAAPSPEDLVGGLDQPRGLALDLAAAKLCWTELSPSAFQHANLDGSGAETLEASPFAFGAVAVDRPADRI